MDLQTAMENSGSNLSPEEFLYFKRLVLAEAGNEGYDGMLAVAAVIMNRVKAGKEFSNQNTVVDVINASGQFSTVKNKVGTNPSNIPGADSQGSAAWANVDQAVTDALNGLDNVTPKLKNAQTALYFRCDVEDGLGKDLFNQRVKNKEICYIRYDRASDNVFTYDYDMFSK